MKPLLLPDVAAALTQDNPFSAHSFKELSRACHPDLHPGDTKAEALFKELSRRHTMHEAPASILSPKKRKYVLTSLLAVGDVADVHAAESDGKQYVVKVSRVPSGTQMLEIERQAISAILTTAGDTSYAKYFPLLAESFLVGSRRVNAFAFEDGFVPVEQLPKDLDGRHVAWIFKRLLTAIGFVHKCGWCHGAVLPSHALIHPVSHGLKLVGLGQAVKLGERATGYSKRFADLYAPEVLAKKPACAATDIYMAARCFGRFSPPKPIAAFMNSCLLPSPGMRPDDAWKLLSEFDEVLRGVYGAPKYVKLKL